MKCEKSESEKLLAWYDMNRRILPWREDPTPYHVWLSEIMLQQTRVEAVRGYYDRFLRELPDIESLAEAPEDKYLKLWQGLGYYSRVRNMHRAAEIVVRECGGKMPCTARELRELPGIGDYTAAAIASISYREKVPAVDGNLLRIFSRLAAYDENIKTPKAKRDAGEFWKERMPEDRPGDFNQALMDLGSAVCLPGKEPHCGECPLADACLADRQGRQAEFPHMPVKKSRKVEYRTVFIVYRGEKVAVRKRPDRGLLAGLYEFPNVEGALSEKEAQQVLGKNGVEPIRIHPIGTAKHVFSHVEWHMTGYEVRADELSPPGRVFIWAAPEEIRERFAIPSAFSAWVKCLWK